MKEDESVMIRLMEVSLQVKYISDQQIIINASCLRHRHASRRDLINGLLRCDCTAFAYKVIAVCRSEGVTWIHVSHDVNHRLTTQHTTPPT